MGGATAESNLCPYFHLLVSAYFQGSAKFREKPCGVPYTSNLIADFTPAGIDVALTVRYGHVTQDLYLKFYSKLWINKIPHCHFSEISNWEFLQRNNTIIILTT